MRTRRSNRNKSYNLDTYDFLSSGDEQQPPKRRKKQADDEDENFGTGPADRSAEEEEDEDVQMNESASEADAGASSSRPRERPAKSSQAKARGAPTYLDIELIPPEAQHKGYLGPYERGMRGRALVRAWYGPRVERIDKAHELLDRWTGWTILPPKVPVDINEPTDKGFWLSGAAPENETRLANQWISQVSKVSLPEKAWVSLYDQEADPYRLPDLSMPVLVGPAAAPLEVTINGGTCHSISQNGIPLDQDDREGKEPTGWLFDVSGIVLGMDWTPRRDKNTKQILALAIIPHEDQSYQKYVEGSARREDPKQGIIEIWEFESETTDDDFIRPSKKPGIRKKTLCFDYGRVRRIRWSPTCNHIAMLCGDGAVYVVDAGDLDKEEENAYYKLQEPIAALSLADEYGIDATALVWVNCNRIAVGYKDGSIALWSIHPKTLVSRHPVHHNHIIDMVSGYPTMPHLIASIPIGGTARMLDLRAPSYETSEVQRPLVHTQPGLLAYSDHLLGFLSIYPSASALNTIIGFLHYGHFPVARRVFTGDSFLTCLAIGRLHPFLLVGAIDGSLWCLSAQNELFSNRHESTDKLRVFLHEHLPPELFPPDSPAAAKGVCRISQGFKLEKNRNTKQDTKVAAKKSKKIRSKETNASADAADGMEEDEEVGDLTDPSRAVLHEPLSRITTIEWNPNVDYGSWAAVSMGSGLVRILDLGLEKEPGQK